MLNGLHIFGDILAEKSIWRSRFQLFRICTACQQAGNQKKRTDNLYFHDILQPVKKGLVYKK